MSTLPANLPPARLPAVYEQACTAIATCERIDECKDWSDKAAALASYAKQAEDETLMNHARRIHMRAVNRIGELLKEIQPARGAHWQSKRDGTVPSTRKQAAEDAGLSERQRKTALRVANMPRKEFEAAVESETPPTLTALTGRDATKVRNAGEAWGVLNRFSAWVRRNEPGQIAAGFLDHERQESLAQAESIIQWLEEFSACLRETI